MIENNLQRLYDCDEFIRNKSYFNYSLYGYNI